MRTDDEKKICLRYIVLEKLPMFAFFEKNLLLKELRKVVAILEIYNKIVE